MIVGVYDEDPGPEEGLPFDRKRAEIGTRAPESLASRMKRDLDAWNAAKAIVARVQESSKG